MLTFDDGPLAHHTAQVLETLAAECVKATFFLVGRQARAFPGWVRRIHEEGHTIATHSQNHPTIFTRLSMGAAEQEITQGMESVGAALGDPSLVAPFFRFPGLGRSRAVEAYLASRGIMVWSADFPADDWTHISGEEVMRRALERLERRGRGILLLHDIQPATAAMLPHLLRELRDRGFHIVHVVPSGPDNPKPSPIPKRGSSTSRGLRALPSRRSRACKASGGRIRSGRRWWSPCRSPGSGPIPALRVRHPLSRQFSTCSEGSAANLPQRGDYLCPEDTLAAMVAPPATLPPRPKLRP